MLSKIYPRQILAVFLMLMPCCALQSKGPKTHNAYHYGYVDWHSWACYLAHHLGYQPYQPVTDIKKYGCNWGAWITFPQKIEAIQARVGNMSSPFELLRSKDFLAMYKHSWYYKEAFLNYIVDNRYSLAQKKIAIYAMRQSPFTSWEMAYELYKNKKIEFPLLELMLVISIVNDDRFLHHLAFDSWSNKRTKEDYVSLLEAIQNNIPKNSCLYKGIASILLNKKCPKSWDGYRMHRSCGPPRDYYEHSFPFYHILTDAVRDANDWEASDFGGNLLGLATHPYFLMVMEHPLDYYPAHFELGPRRQKQDRPKRCGNGIDVLRYEGYTDEEKSMAIFGMSQLNADYYAFMIEHAIEWYKQGNLSVHHLLQLFICNFPTFYKYPFFILDYKKKDIQEALNKFIAEPTIPEGIKAIALKVKNGTLATKEELDYMEGYRTFRKTHFTLYETIVPHG